MASNSTPTPFQMLQQLTAQHANEIANHVTDDSPSSDEELDSNSPIYDSFYNEVGPAAIKSLTNFSLLAFTEIWLSVCSFLFPNWNTERGRKTNIQAKDVLFMMMTVLKHVFKE